MKAAVFIDGGYLRVLARTAGHRYVPDFIETFAHACIGRDEEYFRALYYDCAPYRGSLTLPVSGIEREFRGNDQWLNDLAARPRFAVRRGALKFRGFKPRRIPVAPTTLTDDDIPPRLRAERGGYAPGSRHCEICICTSRGPGNPRYRRYGLSAGNENRTQGGLPSCSGSAA